MYGILFLIGLALMIVGLIVIAGASPSTPSWLRARYAVGIGVGLMLGSLIVELLWPPT